ncbi:Long-chain-fatty-acid--CoA ligase 3 [Thelohanellus kitauei]|uniref:long-chain-fatty-acid--CoA ligase n=1 Tax=Thelohanellus kitauei TaxID=669202 RepID=A0A0C2IKH2_THEKT|nr:Long-chain-fatty-acid--CoA ligase 3 [Thelohanellus kitauei]
MNYILQRNIWSFCFSIYHIIPIRSPQLVRPYSVFRIPSSSKKPSYEMEDPEEIVLIKNPYLHEQLFVGVIKFFGYGFGMLPALPHFISNGKVPTSKALSNQSYSYVEHGERVYRSHESKDQLITKFGDVKTLNQSIMRSAKLHPDRRCFGKRVLLNKKEEFDALNQKMVIKYSFGDFVWKTYEMVWNDVQNISRFLIDNHIDSQQNFALFANTSLEWLTMTLSLLNVSCPIVTVYPSLSDDAITYAFDLTKITGVLVDEKTLPRLMLIIDKLPHLKHVIISTHIEPVKTLPEKGSRSIEFNYFDNVLQYKSDTNPQSHEPQDTNALAVIMFTSGSSGIPKGVMISHKNILAVAASVQNNPAINKHHRYAAFLPSSHVFEFFMELAMLLFGSTIGFCTPLTLLDTSPMIQPGTKGDLVVFRPTFMIAVPLFLERVEKGIIQQLKLKSRIKQLLFQTCYSMKMFYRNYGFDTPILDRYPI